MTKGRRTTRTKKNKKDKLSSMATMVPPMMKTQARKTGWAPEFTKHADTEAEDNGG